MPRWMRVRGSGITPKTPDWLAERAPPPAAAPSTREAAMANNPHGLQVGGTLYLVPTDSRNRDEHHVEIIRVGRTWATVAARLDSGELSRSENRVALSNLRVDGGEYSPRWRAYLSKEAYEADKYLRSAWKALADAMHQRWTPPAGTSVEKIRQAVKLLGLDQGGDQ